VTRRPAALALALAAAACGGKHADDGTGPLDDVAADGVDDGELDGAGEGVDESGDSPELVAERIAAVQWSMGQLEGAAHLCWAAAAVDDFRLGGAITAQLTFAAPVASAAPAVSVVRDEPADPVLTPCLVRALEAFRWPPPLAGEVVQIPFEFQAPKAQYVIDRTMVAAAGGSRAIITSANTGQGAVTLLEEALGPSRGYAGTDPAVWVALSAGALRSGKKTLSLTAGDALLVGAGVSLEAASDAGTMIRVGLAGASWTAASPLVVRRKDAKAFESSAGVARLLLDPTRVKPAPPVAVIEHVFSAGVAAPTHTHEATEVVYLTAGRGTTTIDGVTLDVGPTSVVVIPPGVPHSFNVIDEIHAIQLYTPGGPEQRFKATSP
jgi:quercetin dioxygenase-like cupin family protein